MRGGQILKCAGNLLQPACNTLRSGRCKLLHHATRIILPYALPTCLPVLFWVPLCCLRILAFLLPSSSSFLLSFLPVLLSSFWLSSLPCFLLSLFPFHVSIQSFLPFPPSLPPSFLPSFLSSFLPFFLSSLPPSLPPSFPEPGLPFAFYCVPSLLPVPLILH